MASGELIKIGDIAPDFTLKDQAKHDVTLSALKGQRVLLSWHPLAWTKVCAEQMKSVEEHFEDMEKLNTVPLGLSVDTVPSKAAWAKELGISRLRLLSDFWPHGVAAQSYDLFRAKEGFSERANIIIDPEGKIIFIKIYDLPQLPDIEEILSFLRK
ncbi:MAG: redoxin domain-containing protein [Candidatus Aminicenantes bacterium]|jgi:peroxiredoxin|nr:redoxin domain-containing protein [Candidatus Aminicenantes bacterium]